MSELTADDVEAYTGGQLSANDDETQRMLDAALAAARFEVGWHVSPVRENDIITLDGEGGNRLWLPTQNIVKLSAVTVDGVALDLTNDVVLAANNQSLLIRRRGTWPWGYAAITVTIDHGYTEAQAADWRQAILSMVDQMASMASIGRSASELQSKQVDDVVYRWEATPMPVRIPSVAAILDNYRLLRLFA